MYLYSKINVGEKEIEEIEEIIFLGQVISFKNKWRKEITRRIKNLWAKFSVQNAFYKGNLSLKMKNTLPVLSYGTQTWGPIIEKCYQC